MWVRALAACVSQPEFQIPEPCVQAGCSRASCNPSVLLQGDGKQSLGSPQRLVVLLA